MVVRATLLLGHGGCGEALVLPTLPGSETQPHAAEGGIGGSGGMAAGSEDSGGCCGW